MDGNGRMGRFLMNAMLASGGYRWTIISKDIIDDYMAAIEKASVDGDIRELATLLSGIVRNNNDRPWSSESGSSSSVVVFQVHYESKTCYGRT